MAVLGLGLGLVSSLTLTLALKQHYLKRDRPRPWTRPKPRPRPRLCVLLTPIFLPWIVSRFALLMKIKCLQLRTDVTEVRTSDSVRIDRWLFIYLFISSIGLFGYLQLYFLSAHKQQRLVYSRWAVWDEYKYIYTYIHSNIRFHPAQQNLHVDVRKIVQLKFPMRGCQR